MRDCLERHAQANEVEAGFAGSVFDIGYVFDYSQRHVQDAKVAENRNEACQGAT